MSLYCYATSYALIVDQAQCVSVCVCVCVWSCSLAVNRGVMTRLLGHYRNVALLSSEHKITHTHMRTHTHTHSHKHQSAHAYTSTTMITFLLEEVKGIMYNISLQFHRFFSNVLL